MTVHLAFHVTLSKGPGILVSPTGGRRARKLNVDDPPDLGDCGGELRGGELGESWGIGTREMESAFAHKHPPPANSEGYDMSRLVLWSETYKSGQAPDIRRIDLASGVLLDPGMEGLRLAVTLS